MITTNGIHIALARLACSFLFLKNATPQCVCHPLETGNAFCCVERSEWRASCQHEFVASQDRNQFRNLVHNFVHK